MFKRTLGSVLAFMLFTFVFTGGSIINYLSAETKNPDKPLKGTWDFRPHKVWQIEKVGDEVFAHPFSLRVSGKDNLYIYDARAEINYIFDQNGGFVRSFAPAGEGPGEIIGQGRTFIVNNTVLITGMNGVHYFTEEGEYIRSNKEAGLGLPIHLFLSEDELISAPLTGIHTPDGKGKIMYQNLESKTERVIAEFTSFQGGVGQSGQQVFDMIVAGLSPLLTVGYDNNRIYWGMSDDYAIHISDLGGKILNSFSINRKKTKVSKNTKKRYFKGGGLPADALDQIVNSFPEAMTYFHRIEVHKEFIFVYVPELDIEAGHAKIKQIDIFTLEGRYLYRAKIELEQGLTPLFSPLENLTIYQGSLYVVCEKEDDSIIVAKFDITLPAE